MHQIPTDLLKKSAHWREDIQFTQDVLGKPFHYQHLGNFLARKTRRG